MGPRTLSSRWHVSREQAEADMAETLESYTRSHSYSMSPAVGKVKSSVRQRRMLERRAIVCHCCGGLAMNDPDLRKLVRKGFMKFVRIPYGKGWGGNYELRRTYAVITPKGEAELARLSA